MTPRTKRTGTAPVAPPGEHGFSLISKQKLVGLYTAMLKCRLLERRMRDEALTETPRARGREAVAAAVAGNLQARDHVFAIDGSVLPGLAHDGAAERALAMLKFAGRARRAAPDVEAMWKEALSSARALKRKKSKNIVALFCGKTPAPKDVLRDAASEQLPILFICQQNRLHDKTLDAPDGSFPSIPPSIPVDCEDAVAIYRVVAEALAHARRGNGPTLMECKQWKVAGQAPAGRRSGALRAMERYLAAKGLWSSQIKKKTAEEFAHELEEAGFSAK
jgi:pyruvate dehydrogenase E1 component alpha subunit